MKKRDETGPSGSSIGRHSPLAMVVAGVTDGGSLLSPSARERLLKLARSGGRGAGQLRFESIPRNQDRKDAGSRVFFRVFAGERSLAHLTIGRGLSSLWRRIQAFHKACPTISSAPLFYEKQGELEYLAVEYFQGESLETLVGDGRMGQDEAMTHVRQVLEVLESTTKPSTPDAAGRELEALFERVSSCDSFGLLDARFLHAVVFPFIREGLGSGMPKTRWTNGDLVPRNLLVSPRGEVCLIDCEYAGRTHFYAEDWWRWHRFSKLPVVLRDLPGLKTGVRSEAALEAYFILRQIVLSHETSLLHLASSDARHWTERLVAILGSSHGQFRSSLLLSSLGLGLAAKPGGESTVQRLNAQLFWSSGDDFTEENSHVVVLAPDDECVLKFIIQNPGRSLHLRLDPVNKVGMLRISSLRVRAQGGGPPLLVLTESTGWEEVRLGSGLLRLADSPELNLLSLNEDPTLLLPAIALEEPTTSLICEVWIRFQEDLSSLPGYLKQVRAGVSDHAPDALRAESEAYAGRLQLAEQDLLAKTAWVKDLEQAVGDRDTMIAQQAARIAALDQDLLQRAERIGYLENQVRNHETDFRQNEVTEVELRERLSQAEDSKGASEALLAGVRVELAQTGEALSALKASVAEMELRCTALGTERDSLRSVVDTLEKRMAGELQHVAELERAVESRDLESARHREKAKAVEAELGQLQGQLAQTQELLRQKESEQAALLKSRDLIGRELAEAKSEVARLRQTLHANETTMEERVRGLTLEQSRLGALLVDREACIARLKTSAGDQSLQIKQLERLLEEARVSSETCNERRQKLEQELQVRQASEQALESRVQVMLREQDRLGALLEDREGSLAQLKTSIEEQTSQFEQTRRLLAEAIARGENSKLDLEKLELDLRTKHSHERELESQELARARSQVEQLHHELRDSETRLEAEEAKAEAFRRRCGELEHEAVSKSALLAEQGVMLSKVEADHAVALRDVDRLRVQLRQEIEKGTSEHALLASERDRLVRALQVATAELDDLGSRNKGLLQDVARHAQELDRTKLACSAWEARHSEQEGELARLSSEAGRLYQELSEKCAQLAFEQRRSEEQGNTMMQMTGELEARQKELAAVAGELGELRRRHGRLLESLHAYVAEVDYHKNRAAQYVAQQGRWMSKWQDLPGNPKCPEDVVAHLESRLDKVLAEKDALERSLEDLRSRPLVRLAGFFTGGPETKEGA